jgi:dipeptidase
MPEKTTLKHEIFSKPLPELLDELEKATEDARKAADEARAAGEKAAAEVMKRLRKLFTAMVKDITQELGDSKK